MAKDVKFLLVEDDEIDVIAIRRAFEQLKIANPVVTARDGVEALEVLRGEAGHAKLRPPYIILLDINMPRMNGIEFLAEIREDPALRRAIIFVLTTSNEERDRLAAYEKNVAGYIVKSEPSQGVMNAMNLIDHYWRVVELP